MAGNRKWTKGKPMTVRITGWVGALLVAAGMTVAAQGTQDERSVLQQIANMAQQQLAAPRTVFVPPDGNLQAALNAARAGDTVEVQAGAVYDGAFTLPPLQGTTYATLRTHGTLPSRRLGLADVPLLATLRSTVAGVTPLNIPDGAHHWKVDGLAVTQTGGNTYGLIRIGDPSLHASLMVIPHHIEIDRVVAYVADGMTERRGIQVNAGNVVIHRSSVLNIKELGADSQGIAGWDTPGPVILDDNDVQAAGENVFFGGGNASLPGVMPTDITITNNDIRKPLAWHGQPLGVKNLLEIKAGRRVTIRGNRFDGNWPDGQAGYSIVFTPRAQSGACSWCVVEDVLFESNTLDHAASGFDILAFDNEATPAQRPSTPAQRIVIRNNRIRLDSKTFGGEGRCYMLLQVPKDIIIDHNTCLADGGAVLAVEGPKASGFVFTNNLQRNGPYGIIGAGTAPGLPTIAAFFDNPSIVKNVFGGVPAGSGIVYPATNLVPTLATFEAQFNLDGSLKATSSYRGAGTDGKDLGASLP